MDGRFIMVEDRVPTSPVYVALLRGVNVGGTNKLPMAELRTLFTSLGYDNVRTFIQSGNVIFSSDQPPDANQLATVVAQHFSIDTNITLRSSKALKEIVERNPLSELDAAYIHVGFCIKAPDVHAAKELDRERFVPEKFEIIGAQMYLFLPNGMARTKLPGYLFRQLKVPTTIRNWKTVNKLVELSAS